MLYTKEAEHVNRHILRSLILIPLCMTPWHALCGSHKNMFTLITVTVRVGVFAAWNVEAEIQLLFHHLPRRQHSQPAQPQIHHQMVKT